MKTPRVGEWVVLREVPPWVEELPAESRAVFHHCVGHPFPVTEVDANGNLVLDVSARVDLVFSGEFNDLRVEPRFVRRSSGQP